MPLIKVCRATIPHGILTTNFEVEDIVDTWIKSGKGKWVSENCKALTTEVNDSWADGSLAVTIIADFTREQHITYKLMWLHEI